MAKQVKNQPDLHFTDDASLCESFGIPVGIFAGDVRNIKLTYTYEFEFLQILLNQALTHPKNQPGKENPCASE